MTTAPRPSRPNPSQIPWRFQRDFTLWDPVADPKAPERWEHPERALCVIDEPGDDAAPALTAAALRGVVSIIVQPQERWEAVAARPKTEERLPPALLAAVDRLVPAVKVTCMADLEKPDLIRSVVRARSCSAPRALVIEPREEIVIGLLGVLPKDWGFGYMPLGGLFDIIVLRGSTGRDSVPLRMPWVRQIFGEVRDANTAFVFQSWGDWMPGGDPTLGKQKYHDGVPFVRVGPKESGRGGYADFAPVCEVPEGLELTDV